MLLVNKVDTDKQVQGASELLDVYHKTNKKPEKRPARKSSAIAAKNLLSSWYSATDQSSDLFRKSMNGRIVVNTSIVTFFTNPFPVISSSVRVIAYCKAFHLQVFYGGIVFCTTCGSPSCF